MKKYALIFSFLISANLFSQSDTLINFGFEYVISPVYHFVENEKDHQNFGTGFSFMCNIENKIELRSSFIYDYKKYKANYDYYSYTPHPCL